MILTEESINFLASKKKIEFLRKVENQKTEDTEVPPVKLFVRDRVCAYIYILHNLCIENFIIEKVSLKKYLRFCFLRAMRIKQILPSSLM
jgi:hypothetical protein